MYVQIQLHKKNRTAVFIGKEGTHRPLYYYYYYYYLLSPLSEVFTITYLKQTMLPEHLTLTNELTNSKEQSPSWEVNRFSANQKTPRILWNQKVHGHIHKRPPPLPNPEPDKSSPYSHSTS
jgi:hypothetical protein